MLYCLINNFSWRTVSCLLLPLILIIGFLLPSFSYNYPQQEEKIPTFSNPVALLVGLNSSELSYSEISTLSGFELFSVPYNSDIKTLQEQIKPSQIIIKHPSGFVGLYAPNGQLIRGVKIINEVTISSPFTPPSIIQPSEANPIFEDLYHAGSATGTVPHGGVGYTPQPRGRGIFRHLLKLAAFGTITPFTYPGFFGNQNIQFGFPKDQSDLLPALLFPVIPTGITAAASYADARLEAGDYEQARTQPRDYMFQPIIEGY